MDFELNSLPPVSRRHQAVGALRDAIVDGRLRPGDRLVETTLATQLGVSRAPVREALRQLEHEGLVATMPYRGTVVLGISQEEIEEVLVPIRLTIERFAFRKALPLLDAGDLDGLAELVETMRRAAAAGAVDELAEADVRFHERVIERSEQAHCLQVWRSIESRVRAYFQRDAPVYTDPEVVADEHAQLLAALAGGDAGEVDRVLEQHIRNFRGAGE